MPLGVIVFKALVEVMSLLAPLAAAPKLLRAPVLVLLPVPPLPTGIVPVRAMLPTESIATLPDAVTGSVAVVPLKLGMVIVLFAPSVAGTNVTVRSLTAPSPIINLPAVLLLPTLSPATPLPFNVNVWNVGELVLAMSCAVPIEIGLPEGDTVV